MADIDVYLKPVLDCLTLNNSETAGHLVKEQNKHIFAYRHATSEALSLTMRSEERRVGKEC